MRLLFFFLCLFGAIHAHENEGVVFFSAQIPCEKIYLKPENVAITENGIFFQINDEWIMTEAIYFDSTGLYVSSLENEWSINWTCPKCKFVNGPLKEAVEIVDILQGTR